ncbi:hypothetical protein BDQ94DRAFT_185806 [Aspergillus welwitschiae]|uniref:Uncharacterized protein n=1 Tax=Aspergillus welwitschiae TaxID=1341132 RepID=A0A3F3QAJ5_9EURO|nr:hypothetical protein BDQ94DRAFT_185806 [Aspergillus welwitschiae]RDH35786.1 hypothetical protein BDQ94DRAFT_185806 [Aspergillus welwitschiae]
MAVVISFFLNHYHHHPLAAGGIYVSTTYYLLLSGFFPKLSPKQTNRARFAGGSSAAHRAISSLTPNGLGARGASPEGD